MSLDYSADGDTLVSAAYARDFDDTLLFTGNVRIYQYNYSTSTWDQLGEDINGKEAFQFFGRPVALADNALRVAIATASANFPEVAVYEYDKAVEDWVQLGSDLLATVEGNGITGVAISSDGYTVAVGRSQDSPDTGFTRIFQYDTKSGIWTQLGSDILGSLPGDLAGSTLAMSDNGRIVAIGSPQNDFDSENDPAGYVSVYRYSCMKEDWEVLGSRIQGLSPAEKVGLYGLDISADGSVIAIGVGDYDGKEDKMEEIGQARVYRFNKKSNSWEQVGSGIDGMSEGDRAQTVSLSANGETIAVGSPSFMSGLGHVRVFSFDHYDHEWKQVGSQIQGDNTGDEAAMVALDACGKQLAVGIGGSDIAGNAAGAVRVYKVSKEGEGKGSGGKGRMERKGSKKGAECRGKGKGSVDSDDDEYCYPDVATGKSKGKGSPH